MNTQKSISRGQRILGGQNAQTPIPWQVFIHIIPPEDKPFIAKEAKLRPYGNGTYCSGTIIDSNTIISAAHCYETITNYTRLKVYAGSIDLIGNLTYFPQVCTILTYVYIATPTDTYKLHYRVSIYYIIEIHCNRPRLESKISI